MKKFGTPNGAGPGNANEKVGFAGVGTPLLVVGGRGAGGSVFVVAVVVVVVVPLLLARWTSFPLELGLVEPEGALPGFVPGVDPDPDGGGVVVVGVVLVVVGVGVVLVGVVLVVLVTVGTGEVVVADGTQLAETSWSPGGTSDAGGVPGAAFTVSVSVPPVGSATVIVH